MRLFQLAGAGSHTSMPIPGEVEGAPAGPGLPGPTSSLTMQTSAAAIGVVGPGVPSVSASLLECLDQQHARQRVRVKIVLQAVVALQQLLMAPVAIVVLAVIRARGLSPHGERERDTQRARERASLVHRPLPDWCFELS